MIASSTQITVRDTIGSEERRLVERNHTFRLANLTVLKVSAGKGSSRSCLKVALKVSSLFS